MALNPQPNTSVKPIRVMIIDDSAIVRGLITRWLTTERDIELVGSATDGAQGVQKVAEYRPDLVILDIEMPNMSGLEALPKLLAAKPGLKIIMASTLTQRGASVTIRALELGAADYIPKPESSRLGSADAFRGDLLAKIRALCGRSRFSMGSASASPSIPSARPNFVRPAMPMRMGQTKKMEALFLGASTGGPPAIRQFLTGLGADWKLPIIVVQHMPATFTTILAEHLDKVLPMKVIEAKDGMMVSPNHVYIAPGDFHLTVKGTMGNATLKLDQSAPVNWCRPAVDPLFKSAADIYGGHALGVVLTGMGHDGRDGASALRNAGANIFVQDEASSVVWGMPGAIAEAGLADLIKPVNGLSEACRAHARGERL
jgi:two-component system chemotaxis response regulator CheB